ncbi:MAG TPA: M20 family metallo-hydrolase [Tepidisphaeraceae bacterium]|jgi:hydantoinase/carbamoylase family amidase
MHISADKIAAAIEAIARFTNAPAAHARPTFSRPWAEARAYVIDQAERAGCRTWTDAFGNVHARPAALPADTKAWLSGSHIDSVPTGGKYDGVVGVVVPLEILRAAHAAGVTAPLELVVFAEEEGTTFNLGMLGSRAWAGTLTAEAMAALRNKEGLSPLEAGRPFGVNPDRFAAERLKPGDYRGLIEVHVEQGPAMWERDRRVAIVTAINGRRQYSVTITGEANHAGSTPMPYRRDALAAAAEVLLQTEQLPATLSPQSVLTVGQISASPNAINVINGRVTFTIDFRSERDDLIARGDGEIRRHLASIGEMRGVAVELIQTESLSAMPMDENVVDALRSAAARSNVPVVDTTSGALHDAAVLAPILPTAMLFVASRGGISHNPDEFSRIEDITAAASVLAAVVTEGGT